MSNKFIILQFIAGFAVLFIVQNVATIDVQFIFWSIQLSRALLMLLILSLGIIMGCLLHSYWNHHREDGNRTIDDIQINGT